MQKTIKFIWLEILHKRWGRPLALTFLFSTFYSWLFCLSYLLNSSKSGSYPNSKIYDVFAVDPATTFLKLDDDRTFSEPYLSKTPSHSSSNSDLSFWGEVPKLDIVYTWVNGSDPRQIQGL
jgi:hypothetical protein